jgi:O-antigen/teichoic acid export membrane protein
VAQYLTENSPSWRHAIGREVRAAHEVGTFHLMASLALIQGGIFISQFGAGFLLGPREFGTLRRLEDSLRLVLMLATFGLPSVTLRLIAQNADEEARRAITGRLIKLAAAVGLGACLLAAGLSRFYLSGEAAAYFVGLVWVVLVSGLGRLGMSYFQGDRQFRRVAKVAITCSAFGLLTPLALTAAFGLRGWVAGRYVGELLLTAAILALLSGRFSLRGAARGGPSYRKLLLMGAVESCSLTAGAAYHSAGLLALGYWGPGGDEVGYYGLGTLLLLAVALPTSAISMTALPQLIAALREPAAGWLFFKRASGRVLALSLFLTAALSALLPLLAGALGRGYHSGLPILRVLLLCAPLYAAIQLSRDWLFARNQTWLAAALTLCALGPSLLAFRWLIPRYGAYGTAWGQVSLTALLALAYLLANRASKRKLTAGGAL